MNRRPPSRRDFLRIASASVAAGACSGIVSSGDGGDDGGGEAVPDGGRAAGGDGGPAAPPMTRDLDAIPESRQFPLGVMAGDATSESAVLWTRYDGAATLAAYVQEVDGEAVLEADVTVAPGGFVHLDAQGLRPGARYQYAFLERSGAGEVIARSRTGRFRAALAPDALDSVTFAATSCTSQLVEAVNANLGRVAQRTDLSFFLHGGDQLYADHDGAATDLAGYRAKYEMAWARPGLLAVHGAFGMYNTWDDHEVFDNWQGYRDDPRIQAAVETFFDHQPIRRIPEDPRRLWRSVRWGKALELFVLDGRAERNLEAGRFVSEAQLDWLAAGLSSSQAVFKFVLNASPIGIFPESINRWRSPADRWANPAWSQQRTRILDVAQEVGGVWFLSGDFHFGAIGRVSYPDADRHGRVRELLMGAGGQGLGSSSDVPGATRIASVEALEDDLHWTMSTPKNNYVVIRANPVPDAEHDAPWLDIAYYDATSQIVAKEYALL
ncbi:MAG TPA: alkaline phosphatase D family protein [Kofleriaceae bacterium]|nr:alkaline phosphatase D family protein [Kofleriaceae bacterium]